MTRHDERVRLRVEGDIAWVTLARPDRHNGMDLPMLAAVIDAQRQVRGLRQVRAVILHGDGPSFCAGLDFKSVLGQPATTLAMKYLQLWWPVRNRFQRWSLGWRDLGVPVIACVHGNCFGAGFQLALGADVRISTPAARLSIMEARWGLVPDMGGGVLLRELVPLDVAKELTMTARIISGTEAKALDLVTHVADDPLAAARELAAEIATRSPDAVAAAKFLLQQAYGSGSHRAARAERLWQRRVIGFENFRISLRRNQKGEDLPFGPRRL